MERPSHSSDSWLHKWRDPSTLKPNRQGGIDLRPVPIPEPDKTDWHWVMDRYSLPQ